jgi:hypothetical protein
LVDDDLHEREDEEEGNEELPMPPLELVDEDMHERDDEEGGNEKLPMSSIELVEEELYLVAVAHSVVPIQEEEVQIHVEEEPNLRRVFPHTTLAVSRSDDVVRFPHAMGFAFIPKFVNNPSGMDLDAACIMMLTLDLLDLFNVMARPTNHRVKTKDLVEFNDWLYVISDPVVVRVYAGNDSNEKNMFMAEVVERLSFQFGLALTCSSDSHTLSRNQVNVSVSTMSQVLYCMGARFCRVSVFGMK